MIIMIISKNAQEKMVYRTKKIESKKLQRDVEITLWENTGRKNTKANNEIRAKTIRMHWPHGNMRPELAKDESMKDKGE
jgi:hypothetical protein